MKTHRNQSIELLRVFAMLAIVTGHCILYAYGGTNALDYNLQGYFVRLLSAVCSVSVNVLVLISGYFTIGSRGGHFLKIRKMMGLYAMMLFYVLLFYGIGILNGNEIHPSYYLPLKSNVYWFMTEYIKLMCIAPFIVRGVDVLNKYWYGWLLVVLFFFTVILHINGTNSGYSLLWFVFLFLFAGYLKLYNYTVPRGVRIPVYVLSLLGIFILGMISPRFPFFNWMLSLGYDNLFVFLMAVCLLQEFLTFHIKESNTLKIAPYMLGVYLIHEHPLVRNWIWALVRTLFPDCNLGTIVVSSIAVFIGCVIFEWARQMAFRFSGMNSLINRMLDWCKKRLQFISESQV